MNLIGKKVILKSNVNNIRQTVLFNQHCTTIPESFIGQVFEVIKAEGQHDGNILYRIRNSENDTWPGGPRQGLCELLIPEICLEEVNF